MAVAQYLWPDDVLLSDAAITNFQAGSVSDTVRVRIYNDRDNPSGSYRRNGWVSVSTEDPGAAGSGLRDNIAPQDQQWPSIRFVDQSTNNSSYTTDWLFAGAYRIVPFPDLQPDSWREFEIRFSPPSYAAAGNYRFYTQVHIDENAEGMPGPTIDMIRGVLTGYGDYRSNYLIDGSEVTASSPADEFINIAAGSILAKGVKVDFNSEQVEIDQDDVNTDTLAVGESYYSIVSRDLLSSSTVTVTKGVKSSGTPTVPTLPSGHLYIKTVLIEYTGSTSVIDASDISGDTQYGRFKLEVLSGLDIRVHSGILVAGGSFRQHSTFFDINLSQSVTSYIWQLGDGKYSILEDDTSIPSDSGYLLYSVDTDASDVTSFVDFRNYINFAQNKIFSLSPDSSHINVNDLGVGINIDPTVAFIVSGITRIKGSAANAIFDLETFDASQRYRISVSQSSGHFQFRDDTAGSNPFRIEPGASENQFYLKSGGNTGFGGNTNPTEKIDVTGNIKASGTFKIGGITFHGALPTPPSNPGAGDWYYDTSLNQMGYWNTSVWVYW